MCSIQITISTSTFSFWCVSERNSGDFYDEITKNMRLLKSHCETWEASTHKRRQAANLAKLLALKHGKD